MRGVSVWRRLQKTLHVILHVERLNQGGVEGGIHTTEEGGPIFCQIEGPSILAETEECKTPSFIEKGLT